MIEGITQLDDLVAHLSSVHNTVSAGVEFFRKGADRCTLTRGVVDKPALNRAVPICRTVAGLTLKDLQHPAADRN